MRARMLKLIEGCLYRIPLKLMEDAGRLDPHDHVALPPSGGHLYHATYFKNLPSIVDAGGIVPGERSNNFGTSYAGHSGSKAFVARGDRANWWAEKLADHAEHVHEKDFPDLSDEEAVGEHEEYYNQDPEEAWASNRKAHSTVMLRFPAVSVPGDSNYPQYVRDIEDNNDYYWGNPAQIPLHGIQVQHPETGEWLSGLDNEEHIDEIDDAFNTRLDNSLESDPSGYSYDYHDPEGHFGKLEDDFGGAATKVEHPDLSNHEQEQPDLPDHVDPETAGTYEDAYDRHKSYSLGYSQGKRGHSPDMQHASDRAAFEHGYQSGKRRLGQ
mgnify:CR=1 FL=1